MDFDALQERVTRLLELSGYSNTERPYSPGALVNQAYREWVWLTECNWEVDQTLVSVAGQAAYTLPTPDYKWLTDVYVDGVRVEKKSPYTIRRDHPMWLFDPAGQPLYYWRPKPKQIQFYPAIDTSALVITIYGPRLPADLTAGDTPMVPDPFHEDIAKRAYWYEAERTTVGDERQRLLDQVEQYQKMLNEMKAEFGGDRLLGLTMRRGIPQADRAFV